MALREVVLDKLGDKVSLGWALRDNDLVPGKVSYYCDCCDGGSRGKGSSFRVNAVFSYESPSSINDSITVFKKF